MTPGGMKTVRGVVLHIQDGHEAGTEAWQKNPAASVSSHFLAPKVGHLKQMVDTRDMAWCQRAGNPNWLSVENEGFTGDSLTPDQIESNAQVLARAHRVFGVPLQITDSPSVGGLGWHGMGYPDWGHQLCPGKPVIAQRPLIIARAVEIVAGHLMDETQRLAHNADAYLWHTTALEDTVPGVKGNDGNDVSPPMDNELVKLLKSMAADIRTIKSQCQSNGSGISELKSAVAALKTGAVWSAPYSGTANWTITSTATAAPQGTVVVK
jgi:hypothetical protein